MSNRVRRPALYLVLVLAFGVAVAALSSLLLAQPPEQAVPEAGETAESEEERGPRLREQNWSQLGADQGSACACRCAHQTAPEVYEWSYFERSLMTGCNWDGKLCVVGGELGRLSRCTPAPAPARR